MQAAVICFTLACVENMQPFVWQVALRQSYLSCLVMTLDQGYWQTTVWKFGPEFLCVCSKEVVCG